MQVSRITRLAQEIKVSEEQTASGILPSEKYFFSQETSSKVNAGYPERRGETQEQRKQSGPASGSRIWSIANMTDDKEEISPIPPPRPNTLEFRSLPFEP